MKKTLVTLAAAAVMTVGTVQLATASAPEGRTEYMPCAYEDSNNCVWDARDMGNGTGRSYFAGRDGHVTYLPHHIAHFLVYGGK